MAVELQGASEVSCGRAQVGATVTLGTIETYAQHTFACDGRRLSMSRHRHHTPRLLSRGACRAALGYDFRDEGSIPAQTTGALLSTAGTRNAEG